MTKNTRLFLWLAGGVLVLGLATGLIVSYSGSSILAGAGAKGPSELGFIPVDARLVAFADVREWMQSEFHQAWLGQRSGQQDADEVLGQLGLDLETDIDSVLVSARGIPSGSGLGELLVLVRGRFDETRIEHVVRERGGRPSQYQGRRLVQYIGARQRETAVAFMEPGLLGLGSIGAVRQAIDLAEGGEALTANEEVMRLVGGVLGGHAWAVGRFGALADQLGLPQDTAGQFSSLGWFSASGRVTDALEGAIRVEAEDEEAAANLRDVVQGFVALAKLQAGAGPGVTEIVNSLQLTTQGTAVSLSFAVPPSAASLIGARPLYPTPLPPTGSSGVRPTPPAQ
jgi:hypothetical protein